MDFTQLRYFIAVAEMQNITRAAERLHVSQPALSRQISALEDGLGVALFDRIKKRIYLTEAGAFLLTRSREILCDVETTAQQVRERYGAGRSALRIGLLGAFLDDIVAPAVMALKKEARRTEVSLFELAPRAQLDRLRDGQIDIAVLGNLDAEDRARFETMPLARFRIALVLPMGHRLARRMQISLDELAGEPFVSLADAFFPGRRAFLEDLCRKQNFTPKIVEECESLNMMLAAISMGTGVGLMPAHSAKLPHAGCAFVRMKKPAAFVEVMAVYRKGADSAVLDSAIRHLRDAGAKAGANE